MVCIILENFCHEEDGGNYVVESSREIVFQREF